jgi:hypothetical protein
MRAKKGTDPRTPFEQGRRLATQICGARVGTLKSENHIPVPEDPAGRHYIIPLFNEIERRRSEEQCGRANLDDSALASLPDA